MSYIVIEDFRQGLDARKFRLNAPAGTLTDFINGHVTQGGEIEKRKAFALLDNADETRSLPAGTFGMQEVGDGVLVFGSDDLSAATFPAPFSYQRLQHPAVLAGVAYSAGSHAMTAVRHSGVYGGKAWVLARFADGYTFGYYDGSLVEDLTAGVILPYLAAQNARIAKHLTGLINELAPDYTAVQLANPNDNKLDVTGKFGSDYTVTATKQSAHGVINASNTAVAVAPRDGTPSAGLFRIMGGGTRATGVLTWDNAVNVANNDTVTIGTKVYTFKTALTPAEGEVLIGATGDDSLTNLASAILRLGAYAGVKYQAALPHPSVTSSYPVAAHKLTITARQRGVAGNTIATTETSAHLSFGAATLTGAGGDQVTSVKINDVEILFGAVDFVVDEQSTAQAVAVSINTKASTPEYTAVASLDTVQIYGLPADGDQANGYEVKVTVAGNVCIGNGRFSIDGPTTANFTVSKVQVDGTELLSAAWRATPGTSDAYTAGTSLNAFVASMVADINTGSGTHGYVAFADGTTILVSKVTTSSLDADQGISVVTTGSTGGGKIPPPGGPLVSVVPSSAFGSGSRTTVGSKTIFSDPVTCAPTGGSGSYRFFTWQEESSGSGNGIMIGTSALATTTFSAVVRTGETKTGRFVCVVQDSNGTRATSNTCVVSLSCELDSGL